MPLKRTCIVTLQADRPGGVPTVVDWWSHFLARWGHEAVVLRAHFVQDDISRWERVKFTFKNWRLHTLPDEPHPTLANAPLPLPLWLFYLMPQWIWGKALEGYDRFVFAGGPVHAALPLALRRMPYLIWMGTLYEDELRGKVLSGDRWAESILNSPFWRVLDWEEKLVLKRASRIIVQSPYTLRRVLEEVPQAAGKIELALVPVDEAQFKPLPPDAPRPAESYLLNISRINDPRKNIPMLLRAFALIQQEHPDLTLILAGDEPGQPLLDLARELGIEERVKFPGKVSLEELIALYRQAELFLFSSTQEGLGIVMVEAMACGIPVIATDCGGPEGIVIDGQTGYIVPNDDHRAMAETVLKVLADPGHLAEMRRGCLAYIEEQATATHVGETLHRHFTEVFAERETVEPGRPVYRRLAAGWAGLVVVAYGVKLFARHWEAVRDQIIGPLLGG